MSHRKTAKGYCSQKQPLQGQVLQLHHVILYEVIDYSVNRFQHQNSCSEASETEQAPVLLYVTS